jgi:hypothetical protein
MTLKKNSKAILDVYASQKQKNATKAYKEIHTTASDVTARTNAYKLLNKPDSQIYLQQHIDKASSTIVSLLDSEKDDIKLRAATDVLDRSHGKATQTIQQQTSALNITIDLTDAYKELENSTE